MLEKKSDPNKVDKVGWTSFHMNSYRDLNKETVRLFFQFKADANIKANEDGKTVFHYACENEKINKEIVLLFLNNNSSVNSFASYRGTPLHILIYQKKDDLSLISAFLEKKLDINIKGENCNFIFIFIFIFFYFILILIF